MVCWAVPVLGGLGVALCLPATYTARSLLLVGEVAGPGSGLTTMLPEVPGLRMIPAGASPDSMREVVSRSGPARVVVVGLQDSTAAGAATQLATILNLYAAAAGDAARRVAQTAADTAATEQSLDGLRRQAGITDWDEASRDASRRVAALARQRDDAEQQASAARAGSRAALGLLADQPGNVLEFREAAAVPANDPAHALLLGLLVERGHLVAQYAPDFPLVREVNDKIAAVRASIAAEARIPRVTVRETRNPAVDRLRDQAGAAFVTAAEAKARLDVIGHQLAEARAQAAQVDAGQPRVRALQQARQALDQAGRQQRAALEGLPPLVQMGPPVIEAVDHTAEYAAGFAGLLLGVVSAAMAALVPRLSLYRRAPQPMVQRRPMEARALEGSAASLPGPVLARLPFVRAPLPVLAAVLALAGCNGTTQSTRPVEQNPQGFARWTDQVPPYLLGPGDKLHVQFLLTPELNEDAVVGPDGAIALRSAGRVQAEGQTASQLEAAIAGSSRQLLRAPIVTVSVADAVSALIYVGGSVGKPGAYPINGRRGVLEGITLANGLLPEAREDEVVLIRRNPQNRPMLRTVNVQDFVSAANTPGDVPLYAGDIIFVPRNRVSEVGLWIDQYINKLIPFSRNFGYSINKNTPGGLL